jgi:hypothetical protein
MCFQKMGFFLLLALGSVFFSSAAQGQVNTDIPQKVAEALTAHGPVPVTHIVSVPRTEKQCKASIASRGGAIPGGNCFDVTVYSQQTQHVQEVLNATNIRVVESSSLAFGPPVQTTLVDQLIVKELLVQNCSASIPGTQQGTLTESFQRTESVSVSESLSNSTSYSMNYNLNLTPAFKVGGSVTIGESRTTGTSSTSGSSDTVMVSQSESQTIPKTTAEVAILEMYPIQYIVPFRATVTVEADLSQNDAGYQLLSSLVDPLSRTFKVVGTITATDASDGSLIWADIPFNPGLCPKAANGIISIPFTPGNSTQLVPRPK